jgi:Domain of unknown function (DUF4381)
VNPQDPLANLHPLRLPAQIGWWPPAPGWWLLLLVGLLTVIALAYLIRRRYQRNAYRRRALHQLRSLQAQYMAQADAGHSLSQINALLKSVALLAYPPASVAAHHGANWRAFLNRSLPPDAQLPPAFDDAAYQKTCPDIDMEAVLSAARHWIRHHRAMTG